MTTLRRIARSSLLLGLALVTSGAARPNLADSRPPSDSSRRVSFRIRTLYGEAGARAAASDAMVEGAPGLDLTLRSHAGHFTLVAQIKTDLLRDGRLRLVADLTTRREVGPSARGLPLFEEDAQRRIVALATDGTQSLAVLPFGRNPGGEELALDILPSLTARPAWDGAGQILPPEIRIARVGPNGWLRIEATRSPHRFQVEATLEREGRSVALGARRCELGEPCDLPLSTLARTGQVLAARLSLTVTRTIVHCPTPEVAVEFDLLRPAPSAVPAPKGAILRRDSGIGLAGSPMAYPLAGLGASLPGQPDTLKLRIVPEDLP